MVRHISKLKKIFDFIANSQNGNVSGVLKFTSSKKGPCVGITICTHGNEPGGLAAAEALIDYLSRNPLLCGSLYVVVNNLKATEKFFLALKQTDREQSRYIDINMNRLPKDTLMLHNDNKYEVRRAQQLRKIWRKFDVALDIHSTTSPSDPMIISKGRNSKKLQKIIKGFNIAHLITNIDSIQIGKPAFSFYGNKNKELLALAVETGQHTQKTSLERATQVTFKLLENLKMITPQTEFKPQKLIKVYEVYDKVIFPNLAYDLVKKYKTYDSLNRGEIIARDNQGNTIRAASDGHILFPTERRGERKDISEEVGFLSKSVRVILF